MSGVVRRGVDRHTSGGLTANHFWFWVGMSVAFGCNVFGALELAGPMNST